MGRSRASTYEFQGDTNIQFKTEEKGRNLHNYPKPGSLTHNLMKFSQQPWKIDVVDTMQGPVGLLGTRFFCVPHFFDYRKQPSFSLHDLPWVPTGRFKQLLIREGEDERPGRNNQEQPWVKVLFFHQWIHTAISLSCFADTETPTRWEKLMINDGMLPTSM